MGLADNRTSAGVRRRRRFRKMPALAESFQHPVDEALAFLPRPGPLDLVEPLKQFTFLGSEVCRRPDHQLYQFVAVAAAVDGGNTLATQTKDSA